MKKNRKRLLSVLLAAVLLLGAVSLLPAAAAENKTSGKLGSNITWTFSKQTLTLSGKGAAEFEFGADDYPWAEFKAQIKKVVVKEGVTSIQGGAFVGYSKLSALSLPKSMV